MMDEPEPSSPPTTSDSLIVHASGSSESDSGGDFQTPPYQHLNDGAPGNLNDLDAMEQDAERAKDYVHIPLVSSFQSKRAAKNFVRPV